MQKDPEGGLVRQPRVAHSGATPWVKVEHAKGHGRRPPRSGKTPTNTEKMWVMTSPKARKAETASNFHLAQ